MRRLTLLPFCCALAVLAAGCGGGDVPTTPTPTPPASVTELIDGELTPFSVRVHTFEVQSPGSVTATLSQIAPNDPDTPTRVGLDLGTAIGPTTCQVVVSNTSVAHLGSVAATATAAGTLCVRIYDVNSTGLPGAVTYSLTVTHF